MTWSWGSLYGVINYDRDARKSGPLADARNMQGPDILHGPNFSLRQPSSNTSDVTAYTVGFRELVSSQFFAGTQRAVSVADMSSCIMQFFHAQANTRNTQIVRIVTELFRVRGGRAQCLCACFLLSEGTSIYLCQETHRCCVNKAVSSKLVSIRGEKVMHGTHERLARTSRRKRLGRKILIATITEGADSVG